uniref:Uncharacterized protein n=1 Tax=viral metagenome TaxID=1070528 RepID=A0A6C0BUK0_9ZZZZ
MEPEIVTIKADYEKIKQKIKNLEKEKENLEKENEKLKKCPKHGDKKLFREIVFQDTGYRVLKATPEQMDEAKMNAVLARDHQIDVNGNVFIGNDGKPRKRYNECGNDMENVLKESSGGKLTGLGQATGYPDLVNCIFEYYLECKVANSKSMDTSFRSFYLSTLTKIKKSQPHLLVCFKHHDGKLSKGDEPIVIDLYDLELTLKQEWNASNKIIYSVFEPPDYTKEDLDKMKYKELQKLCTKNNLGGRAKHNILKQKLIDYLDDFNGIE